MTMNLRIFLTKTVIELLLMATLVLAEPVKGAENDGVGGISVVMIPGALHSSFYEYSYYGAREFSACWGVDLTYHSLISNNTSDTSYGGVSSETSLVSRQVNALWDAMNSDADAVCVAPSEDQSVSDVINYLSWNGKKICTWNVDTNPQYRSLMVAAGTSSELGTELVQIGVDCLRSRGVDPEVDIVRYCWIQSDNASSPVAAATNNAIVNAGDKYIGNIYPNWERVETNDSIDFNQLDLILCTDQETLTAQLNALQSAELNRNDVSVTGYGTPSSIKSYCNAGLLYEWGSWDCQIEGAIAVYAAAYVAAGHTFEPGDVISIPYIGDFTVQTNDCLYEGAETSDSNNGVLTMSERLVLSENNMNWYDF